LTQDGLVVFKGFLLLLAGIPGLSLDALARQLPGLDRFGRG